MSHGFERGGVVVERHFAHFRFRLGFQQDAQEFFRGFGLVELEEERRPFEHRGIAPLRGEVFRHRLVRENRIDAVTREAQAFSQAELHDIDVFR